MRASLFLLGTLALGVFVGCGGRQSGPDTEGLGSEASALVEDNTEVDETEGDIEDGVEDPLSGAPLGGEVVTTADPDGLAESARSNPGIFFKPAGCITSTRVANVVTHEFKDCTGPHGLVSFNGTVISTWTKITNGAQVVHAAKGFRINGATVDHTVTIQYTKLSGVYTKTRKGTSTGTTAKGRAISHTADYVTTFDANTRCINRDGSSQTTIGARSYSRSIKDYERCGIGALGCPNSGSITIDTPKLDLSLTFPGGAVVDVIVNGKTYRRSLFCNASAS